MQQLIAMMPALVGRHDVQHRVIGQLQKMVSELQAQVAQPALTEPIDGVARQLPGT
jgi:hypothetical protein